MRNILYFILVIFSLTNCGKDQPYKKDTLTVGDFVILENVGDTLLPTDTCYTHRLVSFQSTKEFTSYKWIIGASSDTFYTRSVNLTFTQSDELSIKLKGTLPGNADTLISKHLTILNPRDFVSPLTGEYLGANTDDMADTFRVPVKYWHGSRYPWWPEGAYSINNLPKGYKDNTQNFNGYLRPEIEGIIASTGFKNIAFDKNGNVPALGIKGYATLKRGFPDTLVVNYKILDTSKYNQSNVISYLSKTFIGIRK